LVRTLWGDNHQKKGGKRRKEENMNLSQVKKEQHNGSQQKKNPGGGRAESGDRATKTAVQTGGSMWISGGQHGKEEGRAQKLAERAGHSADRKK